MSFTIAIAIGCSGGFLAGFYAGWYSGAERERRAIERLAAPEREPTSTAYFIGGTQ